jgi:hypothetical protein
MHISCALAGDEFMEWPIAALHAQDRRTPHMRAARREARRRECVLFHMPR